ncbi:MAG TPA: type II toxin-antitoxin system antitoxin SocA domain-containing protein [Candidatus Paceibacterota bacterium]|nr:type II toxin-antitoxin system antitoxin SocA domain-containing protein [Candidatus Paceibacterota bacterium]
MALKNVGKSKVLAAAEYFILKSQQEKRVVTNKKLQKLLYYAQAWSMVFNNKKIFNEPIEAWVHGPTVRKIYSKFKNFGFGNITVVVNEKDLNVLSADDKVVLDDVWKTYGKFNADYLEILTHNETPWQEARDGMAADQSCNNEISTDSMKEYYGRRLEEIKKTGKVAQG